MIVIGLTGSIAMGKSTASAMLAQMDGVAVHCSDEAVARLYGDPAVIGLIKTTFPAAYDKKNKTIDKNRLLAELDEDHEKWDALEDILHPFVQRAQQEWLRAQQGLGTKIAVLDIPLLFETGAENRVDYTICISAPGFIQKQRIAQRVAVGKITDESFHFRLSRQMPDEEKQRRADFVVQSGQGLAYTRRALEKIIQALRGKHFDSDFKDSRSPRL